MSGLDAFEGEMGPELESFVVALRAAVPEQPDPAVEALLIPWLAETAAASTGNAAQAATAPLARVTRPANRRLRLALLGAAVALLPALMAGLAYAGISLPDPVQEAFDAVGVDLPNQPGSGDGMTDDQSGRANETTGSAFKPAEPGNESAHEGEPGGGEKHHQGNGNGEGNGVGSQNGNSQGNGPSGATPPGQGGVPPGNGGVPPGGGSGGSTGPPPSAGPPATPPGHGGTPPGQAKPK